MSESEMQRSSISIATAAPQTPRRRARLWLTSRVLATGGAVLFAIGAWMPWEQVTGFTVANGARQEYTLPLSPGTVESIWGEFAWDALTIFGLLLLPLLWRRVRPVLTLVEYTLYTTWYVTLAVSTPLILQGDFVRLVPEMNLPDLVISTHGEDLPGFWIAFAGILCALAASILLFIDLARSKQRPRVTSSGQPVRARFRIPGMGILTTGIVLWALGTLVLPWASVGCPSVVLLAAQCSGLNYSGVLRLGIFSAATAFDPLAAVYAIPTLLAAGALLILLATWWGRITPVFCLWVTLWLAAAALFTALAAAGVRYTTANAVHLGLPAGNWQPDSGGTLTIVALAVVAAGAAVLWYGVLHRQRPASAA
jgi:hypothetical protein